jgi:hypothetical protein
MPFIFKRLALLMSIAAAFAADKQTPFRAAPAASYPHRQSNEGVTLAADAYAGGEKLKAAFGKLDPNRYGVLPVLVVIENHGDKAVRLDRLAAEITVPGGGKVTATPAREVRYLKPPVRPKVVPGPTGGLKIGKTKNQLDAWEIEGRALAAKILTPGQSAFGFLYFATELQPGASLYLSGLTDAATGRGLLYFEVPLD